DNVRVDAVPFGRKQLTPDAREHERPEDLKAFDGAGKVRRCPFHRAVQSFEALHRRFTDAGNLWIDAAQAEICAEADAPWWSSAAHARLESAWRDRTRKWIVRAQCHHGIQHEGDVRHATRHRTFHPKAVESRQTVAPWHDAGARPEANDAAKARRNAPR